MKPAQWDVWWHLVFLNVPYKVTSVLCLHPACSPQSLMDFAMKSFIFFHSSFSLIAIRRCPWQCGVPLSQASNNAREDLEPLYLLQSALKA